MTSDLVLAASWVLGHGSGIDDIAWFAIPALLAIFVVRRAERRAARRHRGDAPEPGAGTGSTDVPGVEPLSSDADE